ncbi:hypothetical protein T03_8732 [Trichinella britovi]|uniref:Uncharacterized protein n=1 Tax=Trichinella britovi TaxID=45882 RepID=A0A0V1CU16_TRIBR|nr:hypothetical protein T03_8732 [Trichinella britovi]
MPLKVTESADKFAIWNPLANIYCLEHFIPKERDIEIRMSVIQRIMQLCSLNLLLQMLYVLSFFTNYSHFMNCCSMNIFLIGGCCVLDNSCNLISQTCESYRVMGEPVNFFKSSSYLCDGVGSVDREKETEVQREG